MTILLSVLATAVAAICIWLGIRVFNRRERWAKRSAVALLAMSPVLYVLSIGPVAGLHTRHLLSDSAKDATERFYYPIEWIGENGPEPVGQVLMWYSQLWWNSESRESYARFHSQ
jgi:hypothetical protein